MSVRTWGRKPEESWLRGDALAAGEREWDNLRGKKGS